MDTMLERKLRSEDILPHDDETIKLYKEVYFGAEAIPLSSFCFLHDILRYAFSQREDKIHKIPAYEPSLPLTEFAKQLLRYKSNEHVTNNRVITHHELSLHFLNSLQSHDANVDHLLCDLKSFDCNQPIPNRLQVPTLAVSIHFVHSTCQYMQFVKTKANQFVN